MKNEFSKTRFMIDTYPLHILFVREIPIEFNDEMKAPIFLKFIEEKTVINRFSIESEEDLYDALNNKEKGTAIFYGDEESEECDDFYLVQLPYSEINYMNFDDEELAKQYGFNETHRIAIFIDGEKRFYSGEISFFEIGEFVELNMFKKITRLSYASLDHLMDRTRFEGSFILYLTSNESIPEAEKLLDELSIEFKHVNYSFSYFVNEDPIQEFFQRFYSGILNTLCPAEAFAFHYNDSTGVQFSIMGKDVSKENLTTFLSNHLEKKGNFTTLRLGNRKVRATNGSEIQEISTYDMEDLMDNPDTDFLIFFYNSNSTNYTKIMISLELTAKYLRSKGSEVQFYKVNSRFYQQERLTIHNSHSIWFVNQKEQKPQILKFNLPFNPNEILKKINLYSTEPVELSEIPFNPPTDTEIEEKRKIQEEIDNQSNQEETNGNSKIEESNNKIEL